MITMGNVGIALLLTILAGLSTGIGSLIAYLINNLRQSTFHFLLDFCWGHDLCFIYRAAASSTS